MGIAIRRLKPVPEKLISGEQKIIIKFEGVIDEEEDNPVKLTLSLDNTAPVFFTNGTQGPKITEDSKNFDTKIKEYEMEVVVKKTGSYIACGLQLLAKSKSGEVSSCRGFVK
jgi:hypothetical protein